MFLLVPRSIENDNRLPAKPQGPRSRIFSAIGGRARRCRRRVRPPAAWPDIVFGPGRRRAYPVRVTLPSLHPRSPHAATSPWRSSPPRPSGLDAVAMRHQQDDRWLETTYGTMAARIERLAAALVGLGVQPGDRVGIFAPNMPEWIIADYAALSIRAVSVPIYATSTAEQAGLIVADSGLKVLFAGTAAERDAALELVGSCPGPAVDRHHGPVPAGGQRAAVRAGGPGGPAGRARGGRGTGAAPRPRRRPTTWRRSSTPPAPPASPRA